MRNYKYINILLAIYITFLLFVVVMANRFIFLGNMLQAGGIFVFPLTFIICDIVCEIYGYLIAKQFIILGIICEFIFAVLSYIVINLPYPNHWEYYDAYQIVFNPTIKYVLSGSFGLLISEFANIIILTKLKFALKGKMFKTRIFISSAIGQLLITIIVVSMAFSKSFNIHDLLWLMVCGFSWKMFMLFILIFPTGLTIKFLKQKENIGDNTVSFNPFKQ